MTASSPMTTGLPSSPLITQAPAPTKTLCPIVTCPHTCTPGDTEVNGPISTSWDIEQLTFKCTCDPSLTFTVTVAPGNTMTPSSYCALGEMIARQDISGGKQWPAV